LELPQSVGIAGGRPSSSHYFCASQGDYLFYLDPHHPRPALPLHQELHSYTLAEVDTYHTRRLRRIHLQEMDPSMLIAFLVKDHDDWLDWKNRITEVSAPLPRLGELKLALGKSSFLLFLCWSLTGFADRKIDSCGYSYI
jgi:hypothetical protein